VRARHRDRGLLAQLGAELGWKNNFGGSMVGGRNVSCVSTLKTNQCKAKYNQQNEQPQPVGEQGPAHNQ
jgi:hypothetical protein